VLRQKLSIVYYPLWVVRYRFKERSYQVVVDGVQNRTLYGKAPGNLLFRAGMLVAGMAVGNFLLVHGTLFALQVMSEMSSGDEDSFWFLLIPPAVGAMACFFGYRKFRYGEEVENIHSSAKKAASSKGGTGTRWLPSSTDEMIESATQFFK